MKTPVAKPKITSPVLVGSTVLIRTVTHYYTGRIALLTDTEIVLDDAAWIAETGRFADALKSGTFDEVEPYVGPVSVNRGAIVDVTHWTHDLPRGQK